MSQLFIESLLQKQDLIGLNTNITGLAPCSTQRLVDHDPGMLQAAALTWSTSAEQKRSHTCRKTNTNGLHIRLDVLHRVKDAQTVVNRASRRIDVQENVFIGIFRFKEKQLSNDTIGRFSSHRLTHKDDPLPQ